MSFLPQPGKFFEYPFDYLNAGLIGLRTPRNLVKFFYKDWEARLTNEYEGRIFKLLTVS